MTTPNLRVALVGGPMYDPLYEAIGDFEREHGVSVEVVVQLPHPELNAWGGTLVWFGRRSRTSPALLVS